jgi:hypothetical protein
MAHVPFVCHKNFFWQIAKICLEVFSFYNQRIIKKAAGSEGCGAT